MPFRLEHITLAERLELGCTLVVFAGQYGLVTELAQDYATSRQFPCARKRRWRWRGLLRPEGRAVPSSISGWWSTTSPSSAPSSCSIR